MKHFFKSMTFIGCFLFANAFLFAQSNKQFNINLQKRGQNHIERFHYKGEQANTFDAVDFIAKHIADYHINIWGTMTGEGEVVKYQFNSRDLPADLDCKHFCSELVDITQKPLLGVSAAGDPDFDGTVISNVVPHSGAAEAGLQEGDLITFIDENPIYSGCDLTIAVQQYETGDEVAVTFNRNNKEYTLPAILGYKLEKKMTWVPCCHKIAEGFPFSNNTATTVDFARLSLFPNPTEGISYVSFQSEDTTPVNIIVSDVNGRSVLAKEIVDFDGELNQLIDLSDMAAGVFFVTLIQGDAVFMERLVVTSVK